MKPWGKKTSVFNGKYGVTVLAKKIRNKNFYLVKKENLETVFHGVERERRKKNDEDAQLLRWGNREENMLRKKQNYYFGALLWLYTQQTRGDSITNDVCITTFASNGPSPIGLSPTSAISNLHSDYNTLLLIALSSSILYLIIIIIMYPIQCLWWIAQYVNKIQSIYEIELLILYFKIR